MDVTDNPGGLAVSPPSATAQRRVPLFEQININVFWIANNFHWQALLAIVIPSMVVKYLGEANKDINLAMVVIWGTLVAVVVNPLTGAISDYATFRMGRRRPFLIIGTFFNIIVLVLFAFAPAWFSSTSLLITFIVLFLLLQLTNNVANSPWSAIIADRVPQNQRGVTAGLNGLFTLLGTAVGSVVAGIIVNKKDAASVYQNEIVQIFLLIAVVQIILVAYTVFTVKETPLPPEQHVSLNIGKFFKRFFFKPSTYPDLSWVLLARLLVMMGIWSIFYFLQYYADDVLHVNGESFIGGLFLPVLLVASLPTSLMSVQQCRLGLNNRRLTAYRRGGKIPRHMVRDGHSTAGDWHHHWRSHPSSPAWPPQQFWLHSAFPGDDCLLRPGNAGHQAGSGCKVVDHQGSSKSFC